MFRITPWLSRRATFALVLGGITAAAAGAGTVHRDTVTQTANGGSLGSTEFLNTQSSGGALQAQVGPSALTSLSYPFGLFGLYNSGQVGFGVVGLSTTAYGVAGQSTTNYASVFGLAGGTGPALEGMSASSGTGSGMYLEAHGSGDGADVYADNGGEGGYFQSNAAIGIDGESFSPDLYAGVYGASTSYVGVQGEVDNTYAGVGAFNDGAGAGVFAQSATGASVLADEESTVTPTATQGPAFQSGVFGESASGTGVYADEYHNSGTPVSYGSSSLEPYAYSALFGFGNDGPGLFAYSYSDFGAVVTNDNALPTLVINANADANSTDDLIVAKAGNIGNDSVLFSVDREGDVVFTGTATAVSRNPGTDAGTYAAQQTEATVEDVGSAQLVNGSAAVALASDFRKTIDTTRPYMVFLSPNGESRGIYIASRTPAGFIVKENGGGRSSLAFDYRIVARPFGEGLARLPAMRARLAAAAGGRDRTAASHGPSHFDGSFRAPESVAHAAFVARNGARSKASAGSHRQARHGMGAQPPAGMFQLSAHRSL